LTIKVDVICTKMCKLWQHEQYIFVHATINQTLQRSVHRCSVTEGRCRPQSASVTSGP